ncbi:hypothetical protein [Brevibacillus brevis]
MLPRLIKLENGGIINRITYSTFPPKSGL